MIRDDTVEEFLDDLSSKAPIPGGGGASALTAAIGVSLGMMSAGLTIGKKKYAAYEEELREDLKVLSDLKEVFLRLADKDEEVFLPLSKAYKMPKDTETQRLEKDAFMEQALFDATMVPISVMETAVGALEILKELTEKSSKLSVSDVGVGASNLMAALNGAALNVHINTASMKMRERADALNVRCEKNLSYGCRMAQQIIDRVNERLR